MDQFKNMKFGDSSKKNNFSQLFGKMNALKDKFSNSTLPQSGPLDTNMKLKKPTSKYTGLVLKVFVSIITAAAVFSIFLYFFYLFLAVIWGIFTFLIYVFCECGP